MEESNHQQRKITHYRATILAVAVLALTTLSFQGGLDNFAQENVAETTEESIKIYVMSRSINAVISTLQSSQVKVPFLASIQIGELLDPVNDAVERLSSAMVWAIGSLFLQRIVLEVAASSVFTWSFFVAGLMAISALLLVDWERVHNPLCEVFAVSKANLDRYRDLLVQIFIVVALFRFIVPTFVVISSLVSQTFLETEINEHTKNLSAWEKDVSEVQKQLIDEQNAREQSLDEQKMPESVLLEERQKISGESENLRRALTSHQQESDELDKYINDLGGNSSWRDEPLNRTREILGTMREMLGSPSEEQASAKESREEVRRAEELASAKEEREEIRRKIENIKEQIDQNKERIACIDRLIAGEDCDSLLDDMKQMFSQGVKVTSQAWSKVSMARFASISEIVEKTKDMVTSMTKLLVVIVVENIILPIVFLMIAVKCSVPIARAVSTVV